MKNDLNYSASDCFDTFPFPNRDPRAVIPELEEIGQALYQARAAYMIDNQVGLTITYNRLKDPDCLDEPILKLRELHEAMDRAVLTGSPASTNPGSLGVHQATGKASELQRLARGWSTPTDPRNWR
jgi:hypothetical protein